MTGESRADDGPEPTTREELLDRAAAYARTVDLDVPHDRVEWTISERARRRAGACRYDRESGTITVVLTWAAYREFGWTEFRDTIRHELVHAWEFAEHGESGHGPRFRERARAVDAPRHCRSFTDPRLRLRCTDPDCEWECGRHRASKPVQRPDGRYQCGACGDDYEVVHVASGRTWRTREEYRRARRALDDW